MNREEYIDLFHNAQVNLVAFKQVFHCDEELRNMVEMAVAAEREACAKVCDGLADMHAKMNQWGSHKTADTLAQAIRARGETK